MIYFFVGEDDIFKQNKIRELKEKIISGAVEPFNCDTLYAKETTPHVLMDTLYRLPAGGSGHRLVILKDISTIKENLRQCLFNELDKLPSYMVLVLDIAAIKNADYLISKILKVAKVIHCKTGKKADAFMLANAIERKSPELALDILYDLFKKGEKPERILGGLRYQLMRNSYGIRDRIRKVNLLLQTDLLIKTGKLKGEVALAALAVKLCL